MGLSLYFYNGQRYPQHHNNNHHHKGDIGQPVPNIVLETEEKANIAGYLNGNFPIILLKDNEIRR